MIESLVRWSNTIVNQGEELSVTDHKSMVSKVTTNRGDSHLVGATSNTRSNLERSACFAFPPISCSCCKMRILLFFPLLSCMSCKSFLLFSSRLPPACRHSFQLCPFL